MNHGSREAMKAKLHQNGWIEMLDEYLFDDIREQVEIMRKNIKEELENEVTRKKKSKY